MMKVHVLQYVDGKVKYDEWFCTDNLDNLQKELDEIVGMAIDSYEITDIIAY